MNSPVKSGEPDPGNPDDWRLEILLLLGDLVEAELDGGLTLEQRNQHGELAALGLDFVDGSGEASE